jgi:hypothetical protein
VASVSQTTKVIPGSSHNVRQLDYSIGLIFGAFSLLGLLSANPLITAFGLWIPPLLFRLLRRPGEPPVLLFAASFQWLQAFSPILSADVAGVAIRELDSAYASQLGGNELEMAAWLSLMGVVCLAAGVHCSLRNHRLSDLQQFQQEALNLDRFKLFVACFVGLGFSLLITQISFLAGGFRQPVLALASLKWVPIFLLAWTTLQVRRDRGYLLAVVLVEVILGFSGYFSGFKNILFLLLVVIAGVGMSRHRLPLVTLSIGVLVTLLPVAVWQAVKHDYRSFLNNGTNQQVITVDWADRMQFLSSRILSVTSEELREGISKGVDRVGYITFFAHSIQYIPDHMPHQHGKLWIGAVEHVLMPRFLFPSKPALNESERTRTYTGLYVAGEEQGTSISIGYIGESYIDFGPVGMFVPIFLLGYFYGWVYKSLIFRSRYKLLGFSIATSLLLFSMMLIETSNIKLFGGVLSGFLSLLIIQRCFERDIWNFFLRGQTSKAI